MTPTSQFGASTKNGTITQTQNSSLQNSNPKIKQNTLIFSPDRGENLENGGLRDYIGTTAVVNIAGKQLAQGKGLGAPATGVSSIKHQVGTSRTRRFQESQRTISTNMALNQSINSGSGSQTRAPGPNVAAST